MDNEQVDAPKTLRGEWEGKAIALGLSEATAKKMNVPELQEYVGQITAVLNGGTSAADIAKVADASEVELPEDEGTLKREFKSVRNELYAEGTRMINIQDDPNPGSENIVFVGVNGYPFYIKRGHDVTVPLAVVRVLEDAVETQVRQKVGSVGVETQVTTKNVPRFNWYFVDERPRKRA